MEGAGNCRGASASQNQTTHCVDLRIKRIVWVSSKQKRENTYTLIKGIVSHLRKELVERNDTALMFVNVGQFCWMKGWCNRTFIFKIQLSVSHRSYAKYDKNPLTFVWNTPIHFLSLFLKPAIDNCFALTYRCEVNAVFAVRWQHPHIDWIPIRLAFTVRCGLPPGSIFPRWMNVALQHKKKRVCQPNMKMDYFALPR